VPRPRPDVSNLAQAYARASRVGSIAIGAVLPAGLGYWADSRWGTSPWLVGLGGALGFAFLMYEVMKLTKPKGPSQS
jgi:F0F1-type ATP synthase assembly protein I